MTLIESADYFVRVVDFPVGVHGCVTPNDDGTFSVYINANDTDERQRQTMEHEKGHILSDDFYTGKDVAEIECL